jgi:hypothetical protein
MDDPLVCDSEQQLAFQTLITALTKALALHHFDNDNEVIIQTYTSDFLSTGVLLHWVVEGVSHQVANYSKKRTPVECD